MPKVKNRVTSDKSSKQDTTDNLLKARNQSFHLKLALWTEGRRFRQFDPSVEIKSVVAGLCGSDLSVCDLALGIHVLDDDALVQDGAPLAYVKKRVGLLKGDDFMKPMAERSLTLMVVFLSDPDNEVIGFLVPEAYKIELIGIGLAGMPDLIKIRLNPHLPAQNQRVEIELVDSLLDKDRPFKHSRPDVDSDLSPGILNNGHHGFANVIPAVGNQGELELLPIFFQSAFPILPPARFFQQLQGPCRVIGNGF